MRIRILLLLHFFYSSAFAQNIIKLHSNWQFRKLGDTQWMPAQVPGTVHTDLLRLKKIPDPFYRDNEKKVQWVTNDSWEYRNTFSCPKTKKASTVYLQFEGLDTYADIYLNEQFIASTNNMFRTYTFDISTSFQKTNTLRIVFASAEKKADSLANACLPLVRPCENNRHYIRKAQFHFGWDWAPHLVTCGIWRSVKVISGSLPETEKAQYSSIHLVQELDSIGKSFYFTKNGKPIFMKGANWIPADVFLPRIAKNKYRSLLIAAKEANFNMLRVWGGGIYEDDYFYTLCDSLGISIWQDFMFAGAMYSADTATLANIKQEAIDNILRLRKHPCIVLWCGNNEIDEAWHHWGWQQQFHISDSDSNKLWLDYHKIFDELLPALVAQYDSGRVYISSSPAYGWGEAKSMTHGDSHYWGLWWGVEPIKILKEKVPRFMSEYGMQAMPNLASVQKYALAKDMDTSSAVLKTHQKNTSGYRNLAAYIQMEKLKPKTFAQYIEATQEVQSRALLEGIESQRNSRGRCMGSLFWQFNDCWPVCSWSVIDFYGGRKKAYYTVQKAYR